MMLGRLCLRYAGVLLSGVLCELCSFTFCLVSFCPRFALVAWPAECLEVVGVVCSAVGSVDDVVYFCACVSAVLAGVVVSV